MEAVSKTVSTLLVLMSVGVEMAIDCLEMAKAAVVRLCNVSLHTDFINHHDASFMCREC